MTAIVVSTRSSRFRQRPDGWRLAGPVLAYFLMLGCSGTVPPTPSAGRSMPQDAGGVPLPPSRSGAPRLLVTAELGDAEKQFGISAERAPGVTYQPEVVLLPAGVNAIRSLSDDGLVWTLDPRAEGIGDIQPGKVLLLSTRAAGRVLGVTPTNAGLEVVLGPAEITDIIREGTFSVEQPVDLTAPLQMALPQSFDPARPIDPIVASALSPDADRFLIRPARFIQQGDEHDFRVIPMASVKGVGAELRSNPGGVMMVAQMLFRLEQPHLNFNLDIKPGRVVSAMVELRGAAGIEVSFEAASPGPNNRNINADRSAPIDLIIPIGGLGVPFAVHVRQTFRVQTAFSSTGTVKAHGYYTLGGGIRGEYRNGSFSVGGPTGFGTREVLLPSLEGAVFAPTGLVLTHQINVMIGVGVAGFVAGPYVFDNNSITAAKGSSLGITDCRRETVAMAVGAGVGYRIPPAVAAVINSILNVFRITERIKDSGGISTKPVMLVDTGWYWPRTQYCKGG